MAASEHSGAPPNRRVPPVAAFVEGARRVIGAPALLIGTVVGMAVASRLMAMATSQPVWQVSDPVRWFPVTPGDWAGAIDRVAHSFVALVYPGLTPFFGSAGLTVAQVAAILVPEALWLFLAGGILDRLARDRPIRTAAFFGACGVYSVRFLRLAAISRCRHGGCGDCTNRSR